MLQLGWFLVWVLMVVWLVSVWVCRNLLVLVQYYVRLVSRLQFSWVRLVVRVVGSWVCSRVVVLVQLFCMVSSWVCNSGVRLLCVELLMVLLQWLMDLMFSSMVGVLFGLLVSVVWWMCRVCIWVWLQSRVVRLVLLFLVMVCWCVQVYQGEVVVLLLVRFYVEVRVVVVWQVVLWLFGCRVDRVVCVWVMRLLMLWLMKFICVSQVLVRVCSGVSFVVWVIIWVCCMCLCVLLLKVLKQVIRFLVRCNYVVSLMCGCMRVVVCRLFSFLWVLVLWLWCSYRMVCWVLSIVQCVGMDVMVVILLFRCWVNWLCSLIFMGVFFGLWFCLVDGMVRCLLGMGCFQGILCLGLFLLCGCEFVVGGWVWCLCC